MCWQLAVVSHPRILHTGTWNTTARSQCTDGTLAACPGHLPFPVPRGSVDGRKCLHLLAAAPYTMHREPYVEVMLNIHTNVAPQQPSQLINVTVRREVRNLHRTHSNSNMTSTGTTNTSDAEQMVCGMCREVTTDWTRLTPIVVS